MNSQFALLASFAEVVAPLFLLHKGVKSLLKFHFLDSYEPKDRLYFLNS